MRVGWDMERVHKLPITPANGSTKWHDVLLDRAADHPWHRAVKPEGLVNNLVE